MQLFRPPVLRRWENQRMLSSIKSKCTPVLRCGLEALSLYKHQLRSLDFVINRFRMKLFRTTDIHVVAECQPYFGFDLPSVQLARRTTTFLDRTDLIAARHLVVQVI